MGPTKRPGQGGYMDPKHWSGGLGSGDTLRQGEAPLRLPRDAFRRFDQWMDEQLAALVARWAHAAAPCASRPRPVFRRRRIRRRKPR